MPRLRLDHQRLIRIGKAQKLLLQNWREGVSLCNDSGLSIIDLQLAVARDRWKLASEHRRDGNRLLLLPKPLYRSGISRFYYSMYHAMRAAAFLFHGGDDFEEHSKLPLHIPVDFPHAAAWQNRLKNARLTRNSADYDPYPRTDKAWARKAHAMQSEAADLLRAAHAYLKSKGCPGL